MRLLLCFELIYNIEESLLQTSFPFRILSTLYSLSIIYPVQYEFHWSLIHARLATKQRRQADGSGRLLCLDKVRLQINQPASRMIVGTVSVADNPCTL